MPPEAVAWGAARAGVPSGARVLEVGAGTGQLTVALAGAGYDVVALEPGDELRARAAGRVPSAAFVGATFEEYEPDARFAALFASNAFHWIDPAVGFAKAADVADAVVLLWNTPYPADAELFARIQDEVMIPRGSTFPRDAAGVRAFVEADSAIGRDELAASGRFADLAWRVFERTLEYTPERYVALIRSLGALAARPDEERDEIGRALRAALPGDPFAVTDLVYVVAARGA